ncbi:MAG: NAD(P)/FAD-dependent oxidoreductase [Methanocellales archaeon]
MAKTVIIGAGIGGLLAGAVLSREHEVTIFEKLPFAGGRFTNLDYRGFRLSTGALHLIPHGNRGPFAILLRKTGAHVEIVQSEPPATVRLDSGEEIKFEDFTKVLKLSDRLQILFLNLKARYALPKGSFKDWFHSAISDEWLVRFANSFCGFALSLNSDEAPASEVLEIIKNIRRYGGPGVPIGGCGAVIKSLIEVIESNGGKLLLKQRVEQIKTQNRSAKGVIANGGFHAADFIISNLGQVETAKLLSKCDDREYLEKISKQKPSAGIKISFSSDEPLIGHSGVLFTPSASRINGIIELTNADPSLAPPKKHLLMSHQALSLRGIVDVKSHIEREIMIGLNDLREIFKSKKFEVLLVQSYWNGWPVNRTASGLDMGSETPYSNLYVVGDGAKGRGGMEVEGIALGVEEVINKIMR